ncbi:MAG TPA: hypothetical protein EYG91_02950 [Aquifex aeolicus]|nr:hypothetical protein [Aquifex aeolicus]
MKILISLMLLFVFSFAKDLILVSIYPFYDVVKEISGDDFRVENLVPPKADYHMYELTPRDLIKLYVAKVLFVSGIPLGEWERKLERITKARVFYLSRDIDILFYGHKELGKDPHFWVSPKRMLLVAENVKKSLEEIYPNKSFEEGYKNAYRKLKELHEAYIKTLSTCKYRSFGALHPAFGYLALDYNLKQIVLKEGHSHGDISPGELKKLMRKIKKEKIKAVLIPKGFHSKVARILREDYGISVYEINIKIIPEKEGDNYYSIMDRNLRVLKKALKCE